MADHTKIEWTDATWNIITGCDVVSPGCTNCYAMQLAGTRLRSIPSRQGLTKEVNGRHVWTGEVRFNEEWLTQPLRWRRPRRIFVAAHGDLFHESVPDERLDQIFAVMALAPHHTFQILTKRPERMRRYLSGGRATAIWRALEDFADVSRAAGAERDSWYGGPTKANWPLRNVWLGVSVEDQKRADERIPLLLDTPAAVRWISAEPLLGPIDLTAIDINGDSELDALGPYTWAQAWAEWQTGGEEIEQAWEGFCDWYSISEGDRIGDLPAGGGPMGPVLDWVVVGGESGSHARPMHPDWARQLRDQCQAAGVAFHFKQWGAWGPDQGPFADGKDPILDHPASAAMWDGERWQHFASGLEVPLDGFKKIDDVAYRLGKKAAGRTLDGQIHDAWPGAGQEATDG